ncbi:helix-turn-helix domain-containing protein [Anaerovibrio sp. RM50]|uniref:helix-turn-helix domain-containing protein n=1 Tax=Anaerovibrio sp. RM50 TaxID=1200557 RepID=UPI00047FBF6F|nr:helix-turn-helix domain-containing protein [Anaerovibrio sp. RM50]
MSVPSKYNENYHDNWAWSLAIKGATDKEIADAFEISERTLNRWKKQNPSLKEKIDEGKEAADANVERSLYNRATGYSCTESEIIQEMDKDGAPKPAKIRKFTRVYPPDVLACMYWLNNRKPKHYRKNPENFIKQDEEEKQEQVVVYLPDNGRDNEKQSD